MSAIIKSGNLADLLAVRPIAALPSAVVALSKHDQERELLRRRIAALEEALRERDATIADLNADVERALETGRAEGRERGLAEAEDRQSERLSLLEEATGRAVADVSGSLSSLERLAALLARECLDKILGGSNDRAELLGQIIDAQIAKIDSATLLGIEVSAEDFPDAEILAALERRIGLSSVALTANADMPSGGCTMTLRLGRMRVGLDQQWGALRELLGEIALPEAAR